MLPWFKKNYLLVSIITIGFIFRFLFLLKYGDFWSDEMFSFIYSQKAWPDGLIYWLWETNPPLHMLVLKLWFLVFPASEFWARIPSLIFGTTTIASVYYLAKLIWNKNVALISAFFISLHSYNIFWSATTRGYSLLMLLSSLSVYFFYKIFFTSVSKNSDKIFLGVINTLLLLLHLSAILLILTQVIIISAINRKKFVKWLKINLLPLITGASWLIPSFLIKQHNQLEKAWLLNLQYDFQSITGPLVTTTAGIHYTKWGFLIASVLIALIFIESTKHIKKLDIKYAILLAFIIFPIVITILFGVWHVKLINYTLPFWVTIISYSLYKLTRNKILSYLIIASFCLLGIFNAFNYIPLSSWQTVENYIKKQYIPKENQTLLYNDFVLHTLVERYLDLPFKSHALDLALEPEMSWDNLITQKNYLYLYFSEEELDKWFKEKNLNQYDKIILLQGEYGYMIFLDKVLERNNFVTQENKIKAPLAGNYYLYTYVKNDSTTTEIQ